MCLIKLKNYTNGTGNQNHFVLAPFRHPLPRISKNQWVFIKESLHMPAKLPFAMITCLHFYIDVYFLSCDGY